MANFYFPRTLNQISACAHGRLFAIFVVLQSTLSTQSRPFQYQGACNSVTHPGRVTVLHMRPHQGCIQDKAERPWPCQQHSSQYHPERFYTLLHMRMYWWLSHLQQDPQILLCSWYMQLVFQKIHTFPLLHKDPLSILFHTANQSSSVCISQFCTTYMI